MTLNLVHLKKKKKKKCTTVSVLAPKVSGGVGPDMVEESAKADANWIA